jgi:vitamin B12 transporter
MKTFVRTAAGLLSATLAVSGWAQQAARQRLDPVVVSATRVEQKLIDVLPSANVITREQIEQAQAPTLFDLLQGEAGIEISRAGGPGSLATLLMRGQASNSVAMFVDGVRVQTDQYGGLKYIDISPDQIERIEILRGNMSAIYGEAATGGVINIFTRAGSGPRASIRLGSRQTSDLSAGYGVNQPGLKANFSVQRFSSESYSAMNPRLNPYVNPDRDPYRREAVFTALERRINDRLALGVQANLIRNEVHYDSGNAPSSWSAGDRPDDRHFNETETSDLTVFGTLRFTPRWSSRVDLTRSSYRYQDYKNGQPVSWGLSEGNQTSAQWQHTYRLTGGHLSAGLDARQSDFESFGDRFDRSALGYHTGFSGISGRFDYQLNARHDSIEAHSSTDRKKNRADTWLLGAGYFVTDALKVLAVRSTSFRAPNTGELFDSSYGNPALLPESHRGHEFGFQYEASIGDTRIVWFETQTRNAIAWDFDSNRFGNVSRAHNKGVELSVKGQVDRWRYRLAAVAQDPRDLSDDRPLPRRARTYASADVGTRSLGIDWAARINHSGRRADVESTQLNAYTVLHLFASRPINRDWTARLKVENAFDQSYQLAYGYDAPPRGLFLSIHYQPQQ